DDFGTPGCGRDLSSMMYSTERSAADLKRQAVCSLTVAGPHTRSTTSSNTHMVSTIPKIASANHIASRRSLLRPIGYASSFGSAVIISEIRRLLPDDSKERADPGEWMLKHRRLVPTRLCYGKVSSRQQEVKVATSLCWRLKEIHPNRLARIVSRLVQFGCT